LKEGEIMNTCGECNFYKDGKCLKSGFLGCKNEDLISVDVNELACDSFVDSE
jgi:hypothetical protein